MDDYDRIPYDSVPFPETHPRRLAVLGRLFGLSPADPERCRVLELGCADGGNLIPMAVSLPGARLLGVDLSREQAARGAEGVAALGLANVEICQGDILDLGPGLGRFDYVIAHGVYSWVPHPVRERLLSLCRELLSPEGLAYVSYNVNPGWRLRGLMRDLLRFHTRNTDTAEARLAAAQSLLGPLARAVSDLDTSAAPYLRRELERLHGEHPSYLFHEYLEAHNEPTLFADFVAAAQRQGLRYLCDSDLHAMFASSLGAGVERLLEGFDDLVEQEQYMDFLRGRAFRRSVLCQGERKPRYDIDLGLLDGFAGYADLVRPEPAQGRFLTPTGEECRVEEPATARLLERLAEAYPDALPLDSLIAQNGPSGAADGSRAELFGLFAQGVLGLASAARALPRPDLVRPVATALARRQVAEGRGHASTCWHGYLSLDPLAARLIALMDGTRSVAELAGQLSEELAGGALEWAGPRGEPSRMRALVLTNCERLVGLFARHGVLDAAPHEGGL